MKKKLFHIIIGLILLSNLCGCGAKKACVSVDRYLPTKISPGEAVVILLNESIEHHVNIESESKEHSIETCIGNVMTNQNPQWEIVSAKDFRITIFPGKKFEDTPRSPEELLLFLQDTKSKHQVEMLGIRYLIVVDTNTSNSEKRLELEGRELWGIGQSWTRSSHFVAYVIDVRQSAKSGTLSSSSYGSVGFIVPVVYIIPLPPIPWFAQTESEACSALGAGLVRFFARSWNTN